METSEYDAADPSLITLNDDVGATKPLSLRLDTNIDFGDFTSAPTSAFTDSHPSPKFDVDEGAKKQSLSYSAYLTGRAQEVARRRKIIDRLENARDNGILMVAIPQLTELNITQLSMFLRRMFKANPGLREFLGDTIVQHVFEDAPASTQTASSHDIHFGGRLNDLSADRGYSTESESDGEQSDNGDVKEPLSITLSLQPDYYTHRRVLLSADRFAAALRRKLYEKKVKLNTLRYQHRVSTRDFVLEKDAFSTTDPLCARCRPLLSTHKRRIMRLGSNTNRNRTESKSTDTLPARTVAPISEKDLDNHNLNMLDIVDDVTSDQILNAYISRLGVYPYQHAIKNHAAFPEIGAHHNLHGMPAYICEELKTFPYPVPSASVFKERKRRISSDADHQDGDSDTTDYPLVQKMTAYNNNAVRRSAATIDKPRQSLTKIANEPRRLSLKIKKPRLTPSSTAATTSTTSSLRRRVLRQAPTPSPTQRAPLPPTLNIASTPSSSSLLLKVDTRNTLQPSSVSSSFDNILPPLSPESGDSSDNARSSSSSSSSSSSADDDSDSSSSSASPSPVPSANNADADVAS